jgi:hypothetical protein
LKIRVGYRRTTLLPIVKAYCAAIIAAGLVWPATVSSTGTELARHAPLFDR